MAGEGLYAADFCEGVECSAGDFYSAAGMMESDLGGVADEILKTSLEEGAELGH